MSQPSHPRRFYSQVSVARSGTGFGIQLDGRTPKTPEKAALVLPNMACAQLVADEWAKQGECVIPATMPLTRLANVVIDRAEATRTALMDDVLRYARTDLVCYRAPAPQSLVTAQSQCWDPLLAWASQVYGIDLTTTQNALAIAQPTQSLIALGAILDKLDLWHLTSLAFATGLTGSAIIGLALIKGRIDGEGAFEAIRIEEDWQAARWGQDPDEAHIANARRLDLIAIAALVKALNANPVSET